LKYLDGDFTAVIIALIYEEVICRGMLQSFLAKAMHERLYEELAKCKLNHLKVSNSVDQGLYTFTEQTDK